LFKGKFFPLFFGQNMKKSVVAVLFVVFFCVACGTPAEKEVSATIAPPAVDNLKILADAEKSFAEVKGGRGVVEGWATEIRPGSRRDSNAIVNDLFEMERIQSSLDDITSDRVVGLRGEIREVMISDLKLLLRTAEVEPNLSAVDEFLRIAPRLDTSLESDFGLDQKKLRDLALKIAKSEMITLLPRFREGSADVAGYISYVLREWQFTPAQLGLTPKDVAALSDGQ